MFTSHHDNRLRLVPRPFLGPARWAVLLALFLPTACLRTARRQAEPSASLPGTANTGAAPLPAMGERLGTVQVIGTAQRFVLIRTPSVSPTSALADGQALVCRAAGTATATLRVSHERRPPFVVADVAGGEPHVGDEVFVEPAANHAIAPAPTAATPEFRADPALPPAR